MTHGRALVIGCAFAVAGWTAGRARSAELRAVLPAGGFELGETPPRMGRDPKAAEMKTREEALAGAGVLREPPPVPDLRTTAGGGPWADAVICKFHPQPMSGATPKFLCVFEGGEVLKVKYGRNPEVHTEVAATRLLNALGAGADRVYFVKTLRCFGCPDDPQALFECLSSVIPQVRRQCQERYGVPAAGALRVDYRKHVDFTNVAIERRAPGRAIDDGKGWGWDELDRRQAAAGPQARAERDALRLFAVFLNNWDNRRDNQRLVCLSEATPGAGCRESFAYMDDVGGTFGVVGRDKKERKLDLAGWRSVAVWKDPKTCRVAIKSPALHGATFGEATISESGRQLAAARLQRLTREQIRDLFTGARFAEYEGASPASRDVDQWVQAFEDKVRQIAERPPCPMP